MLAAVGGQRDRYPIWQRRQQVRVVQVAPPSNEMDSNRPGPGLGSFETTTMLAGFVGLTATVCSAWLLSAW